MKCKVPRVFKQGADHASKIVVDGIIDILYRAHAQHNRELTKACGEPTECSFKAFTDYILLMSAEEFASTPIMSKEEYYGDA